VNQPAIAPIHERTRILVGDAGIARLATARVLVAGLGGVGSYAAEALARAGVGDLTLVDHDVVAGSNLNRQLVALESTLGVPKARVMAGRIRD
jgi:tRNA A37 threonylcarbamoyladenosine dehydratase